MDPARESLARLFEERYDVLADAARPIVDANPALQLSADELDQVLRAFRAVLLETLRGEGSEARELLLETAVPAVAERGQRLVDAMRSGAAFAVVLTSSALPLLEEDVRRDAASWLAEFFGGWTADVAAAYLREERA